MNKLFSLIIFTLIINERTIKCQVDNSEEALYNKAKLKCNVTNNEKVKCFEDGIYYLDINQNENWEKARQLCSQKFYGSSYADLISLEEIDRIEGAKAILKDNGNKAVLTNGVCCATKTSIANTKVCQWSSSNEPIKYFNGTSNEDCDVITIKLENDKLIKGTIKLQETSYPWLCVYRKPNYIPFLWIEEIKTKVTNIQNINQTIEYSEIVNNKTKLEELKYHEEVKLFLEIIEILRMKFDNFSNKADHKVAAHFTEEIINSCSNLLNQHQAWDSSDPIERENSSIKIMFQLHYSVFTLGCHASDPQLINDHFITANVYIANYLSTNEMFNQTIKYQANYSSILIPPNLNATKKYKCTNRTVAFGGLYNKIGDHVSRNLASNTKLNSKVLVFCLTNSTNKFELPKGKMVKVSLVHDEKLMFGDKIKCKYWNFTEKQWQEDGCYFKREESNRTNSVCECNHLTNFAAIMDVSGREKNHDAKSILTMIFCSLSIICLVITIVIFSSIKSLQNRRTTITCNLCICLLIANILIAFGMDRTENDAFCKTISGFLLYSLLASFSWTLMEGYHLYQMILVVLNIKNLSKIWLYAIGYGAPLIIFGFILFGIKPDNLKGEYFCWISSSKHPYYVWALAGPASFVIMINLIILILALKAASNRMQKHDVYVTNNKDRNVSMSELKNKITWLKGFSFLIILLGITWGTFVFYIHEFGAIFSWIFIVLNGLQGVFIFAFQIIIDVKTWNTIVKIYNKKIHIKSILPSKSSSNRSTSTLRSGSTSISHINGISNGSNGKSANGSANGSINEINKNDNHIELSVSILQRRISKVNNNIYS